MKSYVVALTEPAAHCHSDIYGSVSAGAACAEPIRLAGMVTGAKLATGLGSVGVGSAALGGAGFAGTAAAGMCGRGRGIGTDFCAA